MRDLGERVWERLEPLGYREKAGFKIDRQFERYSDDHAEYDFIRIAYDGVVFCQIHPSQYDALRAIADAIEQEAGDATIIRADQQEG